MHTSQGSTNRVVLEKPKQKTEDSAGSCRASKPLTGNAKSLLTTACLFFTITALQYVASLPQFANSLALRADCLSMFVDGVSYLGNLAAECYEEASSKKCVELSVAGVSLTVLLAFSVVFFFESLDELHFSDDAAEAQHNRHQGGTSKSNGNGVGSAARGALQVDRTGNSSLEAAVAPGIAPDDDRDEGGRHHHDSHGDASHDEADVDPKIVIFFALLGLLFDSISLATFNYYAHREDADDNGGGDFGKGEYSRVGAVDSVLERCGDDDGELSPTSTPNNHSRDLEGGAGESLAAGTCGYGTEEESCRSVPVLDRGSAGEASGNEVQTTGACREAEEEAAWNPCDRAAGSGGNGRERAATPAGRSGGGRERRGDRAGGRGVAKLTGNINMLSALLHVGSDLLRSVTTLIEGLVILSDKRVASSRVDGFAALAVCVIIAVGAIAALVEWVRELHLDLVHHLEGSLLALVETSGGGARDDRDAGSYHQVSAIDDDDDDDDEDAGDEDFGEEERPH
mmetsp:Transcript_62145/g.116930  ORF Transcript_62145/g.116930 Transcript_62145/m.116930 type:complete len:513 (-) Transcript_62145:80-1618(-)